MRAIKTSLPPLKAPLPEVQNAKWVHNEIDYFILSKLEQQYMQTAVNSGQKPINQDGSPATPLLQH